MKIVVIGAGRIGLTLASRFAEMGAYTIACDRNASVVDCINRGVSHIEEPGLADLVARAAGNGRLRATSDTPAAVAQGDAVILAVPALLNRARDFDAHALLNVCATISAALRPGTLVSVETTVPVGATRGILGPALAMSGMRAGADFDLAYSPSRTQSGRMVETLTSLPKVVGGINQGAANRAAEFFEAYLGAPIVNVGSLEAAELVKLASTLYQDVSIALSNELGAYAEEVGLDLPELLQAINSDGESRLPAPGIGVGGHGTPVHPYFVINDADRRGLDLALASTARQVNEGQAAHALDILEQRWEPLRDKTVLVLGFAIHPHTKEHTYSTAFRLRDELARRGARTLLHDPLYDPQELSEWGFTPGDPDQSPAEALILHTAHDVYAALDFNALAIRGVRAVVDGRNLWKPEPIERAGLHYLGIGRLPAPREKGRSE